MEVYDTSKGSLMDLTTSRICEIHSRGFSKGLKELFDLYVDDILGW